MAANYNVPAAVVAQSLGRPPSGGVANVTVNLIEPGTLYGDRVNQLDLRLAKLVRIGRTRTKLQVDFYNLLNVSTVLTYNQIYSPRHHDVADPAGRTGCASREAWRDGRLLIDIHDSEVARARRERAPLLVSARAMLPDSLRWLWRDWRDSWK